MKKITKLLTFMFLLPVMLLCTACDLTGGGGKKEMTVTNRVLTLDTELTLMHVDKEGDEHVYTPLGTWLEDNFEDIYWASNSNKNFTVYKVDGEYAVPETAQEYIDYLKSFVNDEFKGAKLTITEQPDDFVHVDVKLELAGQTTPVNFTDVRIDEYPDSITLLGGSTETTGFGGCSAIFRCFDENTGGFDYVQLSSGSSKSSYEYVNVYAYPYFTSPKHSILVGYKIVSATEISK